MMNRYYDRQEDFEAEITIFTTEEGRRITPAANGIRWDFRYFGDSDEIGAFMIWPEFVTDKDEPMSGPVPLGGTYKARMYIVADEMRDYHRSRIEVGTEFLSVEGPIAVARGTVIKITGLTV